MERPWLNEPDHLDFRYKGYPCIIHRNRLGALCGYVGVKKNSKFYKKEYDDIDIDIHGGLTYASECQGDICHKPLPTESDDIWWIGFDCAHGGIDFIPSMDDPESECNLRMKKYGINLPLQFKFDYIEEKTYKTTAYVKNEIRNMVKQLIALESSNA